jgi:cytochrome c oxidase subunit 2
VRRGAVVRLLAVGVAIGVVVSLVAVLFQWLPGSASEEMDRITFIFWFATIISIAIFSLVATVIVYAVWKFRAPPDDDRDGPPIHGHTMLEIWWTAIPALLVTCLAVICAIVLARNDDAGDDPLRIDVTAAQFAWSFGYPEQGDIRSGELVLPLGRSVELNLRAKDVIHSFWIPEMGQKQDAVPGIATRLVITPTKLGEYAVVCTELCGLGHATMRAFARVVPESEFEQWVEEQRSGAAGGGEAGADGASLFASQGCSGCHAFTPAGSDAQVGPSLDELPAAAERAGKPLEEFVRESIVSPDAVVAEGYQPGVMPSNYGDTLSDEQLDALVAYLTEGEGRSQ